jgi:hypothetical protein
MRFVNGFDQILWVQFCSFFEQSSRKFMSESSIDMKKKSPCTATAKAKGGFTGSPLRNDCFVAGGKLAAKGSLRQCEIRGQGHRHHFAIVRIYYREMRFIEGFAAILATQFCDAATQSNRKFMSDLSIDMKQKSQNTAATRQVALGKN